MLFMKPAGGGEPRRKSVPHKTVRNWFEVKLSFTFMTLLSMQIISLQIGRDVFFCLYVLCLWLWKLRKSCSFGFGCQTNLCPGISILSKWRLGSIFAVTAWLNIGCDGALPPLALALVLIGSYDNQECVVIQFAALQSRSKMKTLTHTLFTISVNLSCTI